MCEVRTVAIFTVGIKPFAFTYGGEGHQMALWATKSLLIEYETSDHLTKLFSLNTMIMVITSVIRLKWTYTYSSNSEQAFLSLTQTFDYTRTLSLSLTRSVSKLRRVLLTYWPKVFVFVSALALAYSSKCLPNANVHLKLIQTTAEFTLALAGYSYLASSCVWLCHQYGIENSQ